MSLLSQSPSWDCTYSKLKVLFRKQINISFTDCQSTAFIGNTNLNFNTPRFSFWWHTYSFLLLQCVVFWNESYPYNCFFICLIHRVVSFKSGPKSKGQVVTCLARTTLGASSHLMWGRQGGMDTLTEFRVETTVLSDIPWGILDSLCKKYCTYNLAALIGQLSTVQGRSPIPRQGGREPWLSC